VEFVAVFTGHEFHENEAESGLKGDDFV